MLDVSIGTVFWSSIAFLAVAFILAKFAWKPILASIKEREDSIDSSLKAAEKARKEMSQLQSDNEALLKEARLERDAMLKEARDMKDKIIAEAKEKADSRYDEIVNAAKGAIQNEKMAALTEIKNQVSTLSLEIAEKLVRQKLESSEEQKKLIDQYLSEAKLN